MGIVETGRVLVDDVETLRSLKAANSFSEVSRSVKRFERLQRCLTISTSSIGGF